MNFQPTLPSCCSVGFMYGFFDWQLDVPVPEANSMSGNFIAIFRDSQKKAFDKVCKKHTLLSVTPTNGGHNGNKQVLAICVFRKGKS